jgi:hypothetical protein
MSVYHYFGAYLEIKVKKVEREHRVRACKNGHLEHGRQGNFCIECGEPIEVQTHLEKRFPKHPNDFLSEQWEDHLAVITPPSLFDFGTIIAIPNKGSSVQAPTKWLHLSHNSNIGFARFPTPEEISAMVENLMTGYAGIIAALEASEVVESVVVRAGYVLDTEY